MKEEEEEGFHGIGRVARPSLADYVQRIVYIPVRWNFSSRRHLDQYLRSREWRPRHARPSAAICEHAAAYARVPSRTRSVMHLPSAPSNVFPKRRTEIFLSIEPNDSSNIAREKEREKKLSIIEKKKDSFLIRDRFENERLRIIEGSVRKRGQWDNERRASGRYTVSLYFPWWNNAHMEEEGGWNISGQRVLCALGGKFSLAEAITKWIKHWSNVICIMGSSIRRNEIIIINYYYIYLPINR